MLTKGVMYFKTLYRNFGKSPRSLSVCFVCLLITMVSGINIVSSALDQGAYTSLFKHQYYIFIHIDSITTLYAPLRHQLHPGIAGPLNLLDLRAVAR